MTAVNAVPTLHDRISRQKEAVDAAHRAWEMADEAYEDAAWDIYSAETAKLNALYKIAKVGVRA